MTEEGREGARDRLLLSEALKAVRKHRGMSHLDVAAGMNMAPRTYQRFEAGETRLNLDHIYRFAEVTRSDPEAILKAVAIGSPEHARRCCDNQLGTILTVAMRNFDEAIGDDIHKLDSRTLITAIVGMFDALARTASTTDPAAEWLKKGTGELAAKRPKPGQ